MLNKDYNFVDAEILLENSNGNPSDVKSAKRARPKSKRATSNTPNSGQFTGLAEIVKAYSLLLCGPAVL